MIVFVTGATSGFGEACALKFAKEGYDVIINGRRKDRLFDLSKQIEENYSVKVLCLPFDVRIYDDVKKAIDSIPENWRKIDVLINNAGLALGLNPIQRGNLEDWDTMIDTNFKGLLYVSKEVIHYMEENGKGHIINIGSTAAKEVYPMGNVYCATKFAVDALTKAMRIDLLPTGIKVSAIHPGLAETEFSVVRFKGDMEKAKLAYKGMHPLTGSDIANTAFFLTSLPPHVNINELVIVPASQATSRDVIRN